MPLTGASEDRSLNPRGASGAGIGWPVAVLSMALCAIPFYVTVVPPLADLPAHVLVARIVAEYNNPDLRFSDFFTIHWAIAPTMLCYSVLASLQQWVGPMWDARIYLTAWVVLLGLSAWCLGKALRQPHPWMTALVALPIAFSWYTYNGFLPFLTTLPLFGFALATWFSAWRPQVKVPVLWALFALLFGFHIVGTAAAAAAIVTAAAVEVFVERRDRRQLFLAFTAVAPVTAATAAYLGGQQGPQATILYRDPVNQILSVIKFMCGSLSDAGALLMVMWLASLGVALLVTWRRLAERRAVLIAGILLGVLSIGMPVSLGALWPAGPRLLPFALMLVIASVGWEGRHLRAVMVSYTILVIGLSVFTTRYAVGLERGYRDVLGAAEVMVPGRRVLPVNAGTNAGSRWTAPYLHVGALVTIASGGTNPYVFAEPHVKTAASPLRFRHDDDARRFAFLYDKDRQPSDYRGVGSYYDYVLVWGNAPAISAVVEEEMVRVYTRGDATLFARRTVAGDASSRR